jgi:hypothetical protein
MKRTLILLAGLVLWFSPPASAASDPLTGAAERFFTLAPGGSAPEGPQAFGGSSCRGVAPGGAVWWGRFAGGRPAPSLARRHSGTLVHTAEGCFPDRRACRAWLSALASRYNARPIYNHCRAGYEPGAPVPPWWSPKSR